MAGDWICRKHLERPEEQGSLFETLFPKHWRLDTVSYLGWIPLLILLVLLLLLQLLLQLLAWF